MLAETINGLYKTELIDRQAPGGPSRMSRLATARWVDWFSHRRLYQYCGDVPPVELRAAYCSNAETSRRLGDLQIRSLRTRKGRFKQMGCDTVTEAHLSVDH